MNAVEIRNVSKTFKLPLERRDTLKEHFWGILRPATKKDLMVLKNISFEVKKGEWFGIIGRNGCGKSTLLKVIAGIFEPDSGSVLVEGKLVPFLELGVGFNPELTARENIFLNGTMLGMTRNNIEDRFEKIVSFSGIEEFLDMQLKNFSSGMQVRLAFAIAIQAKGDVYLLDEVLAVGDALFQAKCFEVLMEMKREGKTVIIVSHDSNVVEQNCDRAIYIREGRIQKAGKASIVVGEYISQNIIDDRAVQGKKLSVEDSSEKEETELVSKKCQIQGLVFADSDGIEKIVFETGESILVRLNFQLNDKAIELVNFGFGLYSEQDTYIFGTSTIRDSFDTKDMMSRGYVEIEYSAPMLLSGRYYFKCGIFGETDKTIYDFMPRSRAFRVHSKSSTQGLYEINYNWK